ncbi:MAG: nucleotide exchange factor GrpE [Candidatus Omnitrophota bacterium]|nr:MAG: nucleotide exchange factor GrpE [Candidatus Omnitrophota bacterium]
MTRDKHREKKTKPVQKPGADEYKDKWLRALAEYENLKKRAEKEKAETIKFSNQFLIMELFPIMDSFDSAMNTIEKSNDKESFLKGLKMLQGEFHRILEINGLKKLKTIGEKFDPNFHEAQEEIYTDKFSDGIIVEEIRSGYTLNDRLLRPALVKVSKGVKKEEDSNGKGNRD